jgi:hypothetical protein
VGFGQIAFEGFFDYGHHEKKRQKGKIVLLQTNKQGKIVFKKCIMLV